MSQSGFYDTTTILRDIETLSDSAGPGTLAYPTVAGNVQIEAGAGITTTAGANKITIAATGGLAASFLCDDTNSAVPALGVLTVAGGANIATSAAGSTVTIDLNGTTDHAVQVGNATNNLTSLAIGATNTVLLGNTAADPSWGTVGNAALTNSSVTLSNGNNITVTGSPLSLGGTASFNLTGTTQYSLQLGNATGSLSSLGVAANGQIPVGAGAAADPVLANITSARDLAVANGAGTIDITMSNDAHNTAITGWNGSIIETIAATVASDGFTITLSVQQSGGGDLTVIFSDGYFAWDTSPSDTIVLTEGADNAPQLNYVYMLQTTKALTVSTVGWPATEHAAIATVMCQSAASLATDGAYYSHTWTDHVAETNNQGHIADINLWARKQHATWDSGVAPTLTITPQGLAADDVIFTSAAGVVFHLHDYVFPAFAGTPDVYTINDFTTPYNIVTDLNALLTDSANVSMSGKYFTLVIWGIVSDATGDCHLMVNLPGGSYNTQTQALSDDQKYTNYSIPTDYVGKGFLIYEMTLRHQVAASGTWTSIQELDLRGLFPSLSAGGSASFATEFSDNLFRIYDNGDNTKEIAFEASSITTGTTRTITMDDRNIDMDAVPDGFTTDGAAATPAAGIIDIAGGTGITTSGAGAAVTVALDTPVLVTHGGTGLTSPTDHVLIVGSGAVAMTELGVAGNGEIPIGSAAADPVLATITAGAGISVTNAAGSITVAATGGGMGWETVTDAAKAMLVNVVYGANRAGGVTFTLPATMAAGTRLEIIGMAGLWILAQNAGQTVYIGDTNTTAGVGGSLTATNAGDCIQVVCTVADVSFRVCSMMGNLTVT